MKATIDAINKFLNSTVTEKEWIFKDGYYMKLKKRSKNKQPMLEIHTSGYDDVLEFNEALEWIKWELYDRKANGFI